jgi:acetyl-CoA C-acetyltransferase
MASNGISDRIAIIGMGCTRFGDDPEKGVEDLLVESYTDAVASAGIDREAIDAYWLGTFNSGHSGITLAKPLKLENKPVSRNENFCATGSDSFRNACFAVASGAYDVAMAIGVEKVSDAGITGIPYSPPPNDGTVLDIMPPALYSYLSSAYCSKYGVSAEELKSALTHVAWKNHANGARNGRASMRREIPKETIARQPDLAGNLSLLDCGGLTDGSAAVIICRAEEAERYTDKPVYVKALALTVGPGSGHIGRDYDFTTFPEVAACAAEAYAQAGISSPREQIAMAEVHDCFTVTEVVLMEDLQLSARGTAWRDILDGTFDIDGALPINPDGGLKSFGHPVGATGLRMVFEAWLQLRGEAGERQLDLGGRYAMTQNLGGWPGECLSFVSILSDRLGD